MFYCRKTEVFISNLIRDEDIMNDLSLDPTDFGLVVAESGAAVDGFISLFHAEHDVTRSVVEVGVLRFPDIDKPYFKVNTVIFDFM